MVHIFRKMLIDEKSGTKTNKQVSTSQGHTEDVCKISRFNSDNTAWTFDGGKNWGF